VFSKTFLLFRSELFSGSESEEVQSLSEFRVLVQRINVKNRERKNTSNYTKKERTQATYGVQQNP